MWMKRSNYQTVNAVVICVHFRDFLRLFNCKIRQCTLAMLQGELAGLAHKQSSKKGSVWKRCHTDPDLRTVVIKAPGHTAYSLCALGAISPFLPVSLPCAGIPEVFNLSPSKHSKKQTVVWNDVAPVFQSAHYTLSHVYALTSLSILISVQRRP